MRERDILEQIRSLPVDEKRERVERIWDEFGEEIGCADSDLSPDQIAELDRRVENLRNNPGSGKPLEQVEAEMKQRFGWK